MLLFGVICASHPVVHVRMLAWQHASMCALAMHVLLASGQAVEAPGFQPPSCFLCINLALPLQCGARTWCWSGSGPRRWATPPPSTKPRKTRTPTTTRELEGAGWLGRSAKGDCLWRARCRVLDPTCRGCRLLGLHQQLPATLATCPFSAQVCGGDAAMRQVGGS